MKLIIILIASYCSIASLKAEGTFAYSKGVMANGQKFKDDAYTCAVRNYPIGAILKVTNQRSGKYTIVRVTDRIGKRFAKTRIDLSKLAFSRIAKLERGLVAVKVERIR